MSAFYSRLSYSFGNEDWSTEQKALQVKPDSRILCITASGDRPLHLLMEECNQIICVDANPIQNYLLKLKAEAMRYLDTPAYLGFLGAKEANDRFETFKAFSPYLDDETREFWQENHKMINRGILYQGAAEKRTKQAGFLYRLFRGNEIRRLFQMETLEEQRKFLATEWNHTVWRTGFKLALNPIFSKWILRDPGLFSNVDPNFKAADYLYDRMIDSLNRQLAKTNYVLAWILLGKVAPEALPPYLTEEGAQKIRKQISKIDVQTANVITYLESVPENSFDRFSLSDVASYMDQQSFLRLLKAMYRSAKPDARFCMRQFMSRYKVPDGLKPYFQTEPTLEKALEDEDKAFVYHFTVGKILKN